ncbi:glutathione synthase [Wenzhouxiangella sp. XN24]|uniref:glutathione synthase n=1 Tax=Wenzhouxiangella sp. XN24 TaxID=2713569 RepID=UPI0013EE36DF|nr:glutathione synthase [Wenzhouxiangella sp. XN24]NGX16062.1 glutathione synthase [Wenzhouxiangella sp. XN24]
MSNPRIRLGVVMDPIERIKPVKDTTLAMLLEAQRRGYALEYLGQADLAVLEGRLGLRLRALTVRDDKADWFELGPARQADAQELDVILMRKDPPFDMEYIYTTFLLERAEDVGVLVVNKPAALRDVSEKAYTMWFPQFTPETMVTRSMADMRRFVERYGAAVVKPLDGMGGRSIFVLQPGDPNTGVILETLTDYDGRYAMIQRYVPEIVAGGDRRILLVDGEPYEHALARIPAKGENRGNLAAGAQGEGRDLTPREREICAAVGPVLRDKGILFAGLDVIGDKLTEINVTSPTGVRELDALYGDNICAGLFDAIERRLEAR